ncbi:CDP-alcohol phosphatidyltransferase family protein [Aestuariispira insulae]|uniref:CDP-diacylglycerol--serine O-phosphatidyltransferase n=1 Tax=Aestuariispira insulae TaxID=1461337 RepID=A0A3D9HVT5_9PROT|nr:phosphatidylcholine/phosphatidylserine synthase [Aestuariispira insulae]RED53602.1 CDP-diacylglycerol--serine O-phosphatidyltransferase [Aestuariispira insulae]
MLRRRQRRTRRQPRFRGLSINKVIPNAITVSATCAGLTGIRFAIEGRWEYAAAAILIAAVLDALDGRMARLLKASSEFGAELDSLSDFVSFGAAPAMIMYYWLLNGLGGIGWAVALFFAICMGLRLARFNSSLDKLPPYAYNYFQGVPAPAGAGLALLPMLLTFVLPEVKEYMAPELIAVWLLGAALLLVSSLPTYSFKKMKIPPHMMIPGLALFALALALLVGKTWATMSVVLIGYLATFPFSYRSYMRLKAEAEHIQGLDDEEGGQGPGDSGDADGGDGNPVQLRSVD